MKNKNLLSRVSVLAVTLSLSASMVLAEVIIDGDAAEWSLSERINLPANLPPTLADGDAVYGKYVTSPEPAYLFAVQTTGIEIGPSTTFWLNTDNDATTGYRIWDAYGGAEYFVNIHTDNQPYLYSGTSFGEFIAGPLEHSYSADGTVIEFSVPASLIGDPQNGISVMGDINDVVFLPADYSTGQFTVPNTTITLPERTDFSKRVGIVYSESSKANFYDVGLTIQKAYSQLFMAMQHHCMMAGIPYDMLTENDLTDISKLVNYDALIFPSFSYIPSDKAEAIHDTLYHAVYDYGIGIITAGDWMTNLADGSAMSGDAYNNMKQMLGIGRVSGNGPVAVTLTAQSTTHPAMDDYTTGETIYAYGGNRWFSYFSPVSNSTTTQPITVLAKQTVLGTQSGTYDAVIASETGGRNVHFSSLEFMGDTNMLWSALQWSVYGDAQPVGLKMGRMNNLFVSRTDMDQSQEIDEVAANDGALLTILEQWKTSYNFVGSFFINIGNTPPDQQTDWSYSGPLYTQYVALGNEIGTHSYTHPHDTNVLTAEQIKFEFNDSMNIIAQNVTPTWRQGTVRGGAVPGAPEGLGTAEQILQHLDYLTGGYSSVGAGYPGAFGYLTPYSDKIYFSPNMTFDFTLIEYGIPVWDEASGTYIPQPLTTAEAEQYWADEYNRLTKHASQPIIHWPWHDYGITTGAASGLYSAAMFSTMVQTAYNDQSEFVTSADAAQRMEVFKNAKISASQIGDTVNVSVESQNVGKFAVDIDTNGKVIESVGGWYAYGKDKIYLDKDGGNFTVNLGASQAAVTRITELPMRANLLSVNGDGNRLDFSFEGEGKVKVVLASRASSYQFSGADDVKISTGNAVELSFNSFGVHNVSISR